MESGSATTEPVRVLYVDGEADRRSSVSDSLTALDGDFVVETVAAAGAAVKHVRTDAVDCVVTAADPSDGSAFDLLESVRAADLAVPVVFFAADGSERLAARAASSDVAGYVSRSACEEPFERLADLVDDAVSGARADEPSDRNVAAGESSVDGDSSASDGTAGDADGSLAAAVAGHGATQGLAVCDADGWIVFANDACASLFRTTVADLRGLDVTETKLVRESEALDDLVESGPRTLELRFGPDGELIESSVVEEWTFDAEFDVVDEDEDAGDVSDDVDRVVVEITPEQVELAGETFVVFTCLDVTERADLERDSSLLDAVFEFIPVYLYVKDREGRHVRVSAVNEEAQDYIGKSDVDIFGEPGRPSYEEDMRVVEEGFEVEDKEEYNHDFNQFFLTSKVPWRNEDGDIQGLIGTTRDLSEWKRHEKQLVRQNERLRTVASVISHDIRNPLQVAKGRIDMAKKRHDSDNIDAAADALDRMAELLEELLGLVRHGQWVDDPEEVSLESLAEGCWVTATGDAGTLEFEFDLTLSADPGRLQQLLENLFRNAVMHGGDDVTVRVGPLDNWSGFYVEDDGPGIPEDERDEVFESGFTTSEEGTGFGLAIVQVIAEAHGWNVSVTESADGGVSDERSESEARETRPSPGARFEFRGVEYI